MEEILRIELIGVIPESTDVLEASNQGVPAIHLKGSDVAEAYKDVVAALPRRTAADALRRRAEAELPATRVRHSLSDGGKMSFLSFLLGEKKKTAHVAKERLQLILAHERGGRGRRRPDYLPALHRELLAVISKYVSIKPDDIKVNVERQDNLEVLDIKIELPEAAR